MSYLGTGLMLLAALLIVGAVRALRNPRASPWWGLVWYAAALGVLYYIRFVR